MGYSLFIDDVREVHEAFFRKHKSFAVEEWVVVRSVAEAEQVIKEQGLPSYISFDYDLEDGYTLPLIPVLKNHPDWPLESFDFDIHSTNKHGVQLIKELMAELMGQASNWDY